MFCMRSKKNETNDVIEKRMEALIMLLFLPRSGDSGYDKHLSLKWLNGELAEKQIKAILLEYHKRILEDNI